MKKVFIVFILSLLVLPYTASAGQSDLIKLACTTNNQSICQTVYYLAEDGQRYSFPNKKTYDSWYDDFLGVTEIGSAEMASYTLGGNVTYKPGKRMVKITTDPKVYAVDQNGVLRWITSESVAASFYGIDTWSALIDDIPDAFFNNYTIGEPIYSQNDYNSESIKETVATINHDKGFIALAETDTSTDSTGDAGSTQDTATTQNIPACSGQQFSVSPADVSEMYEIYPLGGIGPPGHTLPTMHMYLHLNAGQSSTEIFPLLAPGDIYITNISSDSDDIEPSRTEYVINFSLCEEVTGYFNHVKELSDELAAAIAQVECEQWTTNPGNICSKNFFLEVAAGTQIGGVGHLQGNFDLGMRDTRVELDFANKTRYTSKAANVVCPFDYFANDIRNTLMGKIKRTADPVCGKVMYDIAGTLQGNWYYASGATDGSGSEHLAFVFNNHNPQTPLISVGGTFADPKIWNITTTVSGTKNRKFSEVTADGNTYCYDEGGSERIVMAMPSDEELKIEYQVGSCGYSSTFNNPTIYKR